MAGCNRKMKNFSFFSHSEKYYRGNESRIHSWHEIEKTTGYICSRTENSFAKNQKAPLSHTENGAFFSLPNML